MYYIPRKTKVKTELLPHVTWADLIIGLIGAGIAYVLFISNFPNHFTAAVIWIAFIVMLYVPMADNIKMYYLVVLLFKFSAYQKKFSKNEKKGFADIKQLIPYEGIISDKIIDYGSYYGMVINVKPVEFFLLAEEQQDAYVRSFISVISKLQVDQDCQLVKISKAMLMDDFILDDEKKYDSMLRMQERGEITQEEVDARTIVFNTRVATMVDANDNNKQFTDFYYLVVYDKDQKTLQDTVEAMQASFANGQTTIHAKICTGKELGVFLKANYTKNFDERDADNMGSDSLLRWSIPEDVEFKANYMKVEGQEYRQFEITDYPLSVSNGWLFNICSLPSTKVVMSMHAVPRFEAEKELDKAIIEMEAKGLYDSKTSKMIENETHLETLRQLLVDIKNSNENLFNVNIHITCEDNMKKEMRSTLRESGFKFSEMFGRQVDGFISSNISRLETIKDYRRGINTSSLCACFPFISSAMSDPGGFYIGYNNHGNVFLNFFRRDSERVNSNMMIIGKSGGGKSYATKNLLANFAGDNSKIFVLDPEYEYAILAENLHGQVIDVGTGTQGRINPFHITPSLQSEEGTAEQDDYNSHLQFLEQYFRIILDGMSPDAFEKVNSLVIDVYKSKGIDSRTNLNKVKAEEFPIFDDLYKIILEHVKTEEDEYLRRNYQIIQTYIQKFATGGRNSNLWNGPTTLQTKENFVVFSFRSLLANNNMVLANAQMLLVLRYLNNEIIKNKEFNSMMGFGESDSQRRKIIVAVDEAHVFIDEKYPTALDFMQQLAKRIRKYDGMQIIITQNIKDFVGSAEIAKKSTAIINASQFTMVLSLAPNDMTDLVNLYRNAGGINEDEQQTIVQANRGEAFLITSPLARTFLKIEAFEPIRDMFQVKDFAQKYLHSAEDEEKELEEKEMSATEENEKTESGNKLEENTENIEEIAEKSDIVEEEIAEDNKKEQVAEEKNSNSGNIKSNKSNEIKLVRPTPFKKISTKPVKKTKSRSRKSKETPLEINAHVDFGDFENMLSNIEKK